MRPKIMPSRSIKISLHYNEKKVAQNQAQCIHAANFLKDAGRLTLDDKLLRFKRRQQLNERVSTSLHITLNFDPSDILSDEKMRQIAKLYMAEIGFERQPYLVYRHYDAGHPHCHIVTTHIQRNGDPIVLYKLGENQSEKARLHIEKEFDLVTKEKKKQFQRQSQCNDIKTVTYGQRSTTSALSYAIQYVTETYKCTNLEEYNTILRLYNVQACPVKGNTKHYQHQGLLYRVLDKEGRYIGRPIKASFFDFKPTLSNLEKKFVEHQAQKEKYKEHVTSTIMWELFQKHSTFDRLIEKLKQGRIHTVYKLDKNHQITSLSFVDFEYKCIYDEKDLDIRCQRQAFQPLIENQLTRSLVQHQHHRGRGRDNEMEMDM